ncbi:MAG: hypothetical protein KDH97_19715 [Calditrichaeota bacterium]|nr:hypothetical protein [Calditrichota bacterium]
MTFVMMFARRRSQQISRVTRVNIAEGKHRERREPTSLAQSANIAAGKYHERSE